jgi:PAS domain S-box-containing protein
VLPAAPPEDEAATILAALSMATDALFAVSDRSRIVFWNEGMRRLFGYGADEVMAKSCAAVLAGEDCHGNRYCSEVCPVLQIAKRDEPVRQFSLQVRLKDGRPHTFEITTVKFALPSSHFVLAHVVKPAATQWAATSATTFQPSKSRAPQTLAAAAHNSEDVRIRELTGRECEVLGMLASGLKPADIARQLCISPVTARNHVQKVLEKLEVHSQTEAVAFVYRAGLM